MILIAVVLTAIGGGAAIAAAPSCVVSRNERAQRASVMVETAASMLMSEHERPACPTIDTLVELGALRDADRVDPWRRPWIIECDTGVPHARSMGADGLRGTRDDL